MNAWAGEAIVFDKKLKPTDYIVALDEGGKDIGSQTLATTLLKASQDFKRIVFLIGGADGLSDELRKRSHLILSFGRLTWPHMLARAMASEQIYRVHTILNNHPYHREG